MTLVDDVVCYNGTIHMALNYLFHFIWDDGNFHVRIDFISNLKLKLGKLSITDVTTSKAHTRFIVHVDENMLNETIYLNLIQFFSIPFHTIHKFVCEKNKYFFKKCVRCHCNGFSSEVDSEQYNKIACRYSGIW